MRPRPLPTRPPFLPSVPALVALAALLASSRADAAPWFGWGENSLEDRFDDGDIDEEDHVGARDLYRGEPRAAAGSPERPSSVSLAGFVESLRSGRNEVGGLLVVRVAFDRIAAGTAHRQAEAVSSPAAPPAASAVAPSGAPPAASGVEPEALAIVAPSLVRACVAAALRTGGFAVEEARIDDLVSRARASAWLPETRVRAMRLLTDSARVATVAATDGTNYYDAAGANLVLELRMTWRFDRLLFAGDEPALERLRVEREEARSRLAGRALEALFAWQRAALDVRGGAAGSREDWEARLRVAEAAARLDVLTGGWFSENAQVDPKPGRGDEVPAGPP